jgi:hypothetical protein
MCKAGYIFFVSRMNILEAIALIGQIILFQKRLYDFLHDWVLMNSIRYS